MKKSIFLKLLSISERFQKLESLLMTGYKSFTKREFLKLSKERANLLNLNILFLKWKNKKKEIKDTEILLKDKAIKILAEKELLILNKKKYKIEKEIQNLLIHSNVKDQNNCFIEIHAASGGDEAAIFSGDLCKMYMRYADLKSWKVEIVSMHYGDHGGYKDIILRILGIGASNFLKFESGGHRVQRVPKTESQGRIHTSTCTVAVIPELPKSKETILNSTDLKIDTFRSSGAGGQHVNTTDSAVRITHIPTGYSVECQDERSQHKNKEKALSVLSSKIHTAQILKKEKENSIIRRNLLGSGERSDRNRTYNIPQNRVTDHRINLTLYRLDEIFSGKLELLINPLLREYQTSLLNIEN